MKFVTISVCVAAGLGAAFVSADIGISPCPGGPYPVCLKNYGKLGDPVGLCCKDSDPTKCINYWKQKWLCDNDPSQPKQYGYSVVSTTDTIDLNCDPDHTNECY